MSEKRSMAAKIRQKTAELDTAAQNAMNLTPYRVVNGHFIHDGDCHFWGLSICTCGLLHWAKIQPEEMKERLYPECWHELALQDEVITRLQNETA